MGIEARGSKVKKAKGASRGGHVNKKARAAFELSGASIADYESGRAASTDAAREMQKKPEKEGGKKR